MNYLKITMSLLAMGIAGAASAQTLVPIGEGYSKTSVNTAIFRYSSIVTADSAGVKIQYASYYSKNGRLTLAKRRHGSMQWQTNETDYRGNVEDGHNVISMAVDGEGYLHVSYDMHGNKLHYRKSVRPYSIDLTEEMPMTGSNEESVTYPEFHRLPNGNLIFWYRTGKSGSGDMVMNRYDTQSKSWTQVQRNLIDGQGSRNAYWQTTTDSRGRMHISWTWRETYAVETNHDICYAYSDDEGKTWYKSDGTQYSLPITIETAEVAVHIPQKSELINQTSMATDEEGNPYIATYWREEGTTVPQYRIVYNTGKKWKTQQVSNRTEAFSLAGGGTKMIPISRPKMVIDGKKAYFIFRDVERGSKVSAYTTTNIRRGKWVVKDLTDFSVSAWEPSIDETLWEEERRLNVFVQRAFQGDGEKTVEHAPTVVYNLIVYSL